MQQEDREADQFFEGLAQRPQGRGVASADPSALAMGEALRAQARTLEEAAHAKAADLSPEDRAAMSAMKERLLARGAIGRPQQRAQHEAATRPAAPAGNGSGAMGWLRSFLSGGAAAPRLGVMASVVLAALVVFGVRPWDDLEPDVPRSGTVQGQGFVVTTADVDGRARQLAEQLRAAGADVVVTPINAREQTLTVNVPEASRLPAVRGTLEDIGFAQASEPPYRISVRAVR